MGPRETTFALASAVGLEVGVAVVATQWVTVIRTRRLRSWSLVVSELAGSRPLKWKENNVKVTVEREIGGRMLSWKPAKWRSRPPVPCSSNTARRWSSCPVSGPSRRGIGFLPADLRLPRTARRCRQVSRRITSSGKAVRRLSEVLTVALTDRPIRPLFPEGYIDEVQIMGNVMSCDGVNDPDVCRSSVPVRH